MTKSVCKVFKLITATDPSMAAAAKREFQWERCWVEVDSVSWSRSARKTGVEEDEEDEDDKTAVEEEEEEEEMEVDDWEDLLVGE